MRINLGPKEDKVRVRGSIKASGGSVKAFESRFHQFDLWPQSVYFENIYCLLMFEWRGWGLCLMAPTARVCRICHRRTMYLRKEKNPALFKSLYHRNMITALNGIV